MHTRRILGTRHRASLNFIKSSFKKILTASKLKKIVLDDNNLKQAKSKTENSSLSSTNENYSDLSSNSEEDVK